MLSHLSPANSNLICVYKKTQYYYGFNSSDPIIIINNNNDLQYNNAIK